MYMSLIVVMEDEDGTRMLLAALLKKQGYQVMVAENGLQGLDLVMRHKPDLVLSDVQMPELNGLQMLATLRRHPTLGTTPVILLTSMQERAVMRAGMTTGADDYITKPFKPAEVYEAVAAQLSKRNAGHLLAETDKRQAVKTALELQKHNLSGLYEKRLAKELGDRWPDGKGDDDHLLENAAVLFVDTANFGALSAQLSSDELSALVKKFYTSAGDTMHVFGANIMQFVGAGLLAVFASSEDTHVLNHDLRAVRAASGLLDAARGMRHYLQTSYPDRDLAAFAVHAAITSGPVNLTMMQDPMNVSPPQVLPVGVAVSQCILLQKQVAALGWTMAVSAATERAVAAQGAGIKVGRRSAVPMGNGSETLQAAEYISLLTTA